MVGFSCWYQKKRVSLQRKSKDALYGCMKKQEVLTNKKQKTMGFIIGCIIYIAVCEGICKMLDLDEFKSKSWVYAIVGGVGGFLVKAIMS